LVGTIVGAALGLGCGGGAGATILVGKVGGEGGTYVAVARQDDRLAAFFCSADPAGEGYPGWFKGTVEEDGAFRVERRGWSLAGAFDDTGVHGLLVEPEGDLSGFAAAAPRDPVAGLYASFHEDCSTGVIVLDPSPATDPQVRGAWWCDDGDEAAVQVVPLLPLTLQGDRLVVEIDLDSGVKQLEVAPLTDVPR